LCIYICILFVQVVSIHQTDVDSPNNTTSLTRCNEATDQQISELMLLPPAIVRYLNIFILNINY